MNDVMFWEYQEVSGKELVVLATAYSIKSNGEQITHATNRTPEYKFLNDFVIKILKVVHFIDIITLNVFETETEYYILNIKGYKTFIQILEKTLEKHIHHICTCNM